MLFWATPYWGAWARVVFKLMREWPSALQHVCVCLSGQEAALRQAFGRAKRLLPAAGFLLLLVLQEGAADLVTADDSGALCVWRSGETFKLITKIPASE